MSNETSPLSKRQWKAIDARVKRVDEDRWISSRFAPEIYRNSLIALYALAYELARVRLAVTEETLGAIRFQWWRDALTEIAEQKPPAFWPVRMAGEPRYSRSHQPMPRPGAARPRPSVRTWPWHRNLSVRQSLTFACGSSIAMAATRTRSQNVFAS